MTSLILISKLVRLYFSLECLMSIPVTCWYLVSVDDKTNVLSINTSQSAETIWSCTYFYLPTCAVTPEAHFYTKYLYQQTHWWCTEFGNATAASCFVQSYSVYARCMQLPQQSLLSLQHTDTYTIWARFRGFSGWSGNIGCKGSRLEAQLKDLLSALVSFLAGDFWEEQGR